MQYLNGRAIWILAVLLLGGCSKDDPAKKAFFHEGLSCPAPSEEEFAAWGESGTAHICKIKHGAFVAFENGYIHIRGQYDQGKWKRKSITLISLRVPSRARACAHL
jgi:hypothetical protein